MKYSSKRQMKDLNDNLEIIEESFEGSFPEITELMKFTMQQDEFLRASRQEQEEQGNVPPSKMGFKTEESEEEIVEEEI